MREDWRIHNIKADYTSIANALHISENMARILVNRNLRTYDEMVYYLNPQSSALHDPGLLPDVKKAALILKNAIEESKHIRIIGDYDVDGVTSIAVLMRGLRRLCTGNTLLDWQVPHRVLDGYGLNRSIIETAIKDKVDLIVTCDNGIAAGKEIAFAKENGIMVVVTDHHEVPQENNSLGIADASVNPKCPDSVYPYKDICGAVVSWKLLQVLYDLMEGHDREELEYLYELIAIATVADVMDLRDENRAIVKRGIEKLRQTSFVGLKHLMSVNKTSKETLSSGTIGFQIGPLLNAGGRLETAKDAVNLLLSKSEEEAEKLANGLYELNSKRKKLTEFAVDTAKETIEEKHLDLDPVLVVYLPECHESIAGIVAGRIRELYYKPTFILTKGLEGVKGSGRSIEGYDMFHEMEKVGELFTKFGGHRMAAGLSLKEENVEVFRERINETCTLTESDLKEKVWIDLMLDPSMATIAFAKELERLEPFGKANATPLFAAKNMKLLRVGILGKERKGLRLSFRSENGRRFDMTYWGDIDSFADEIEKTYGLGTWEKLLSGYCENIFMHVIYQIDLNEYHAETYLRLRLCKYRLSA